jgi:hypothetical protein
MKSAFLVGTGCLALVACGMDDPCAPKSDPCGGDPSGDWSVVDSCRDPAYQNPEAVTYYDQTQTMARQPPPEPTSSDWCSYLKYDPKDGITEFSFPHDTLEISTGEVIYDGPSYAVMLFLSGRGSVDISASCLTRFSVIFQCAPADANTPVGVRSVTDDLIVRSGKLGAPEQNIACANDGTGGCFCSYDIISAPTGGGLSGSWSRQGPLLTHFPAANPIPTQSDICVTGDKLTISGHNHGSIWDNTDLRGLRTLTLMRATPPPAAN